MTIVEQIKIGDRVRSFDFENRDVEGERACFVEGVVMGIGPFGFRDCDRYEIKIDRIVFGGDEQEVNPGQCSCPPVNGTRVIGRAQEVTDGVVKIPHLPKAPTIQDELVAALRKVLQAISDNGQWLSGSAAYCRIVSAAEDGWNVLENIEAIETE